MRVRQLALLHRHNRFRRRRRTSYDSRQNIQCITGGVWFGCSAQTCAPVITQVHFPGPLVTSWHRSKESHSQTIGLRVDSVAFTHNETHCHRAAMAKGGGTDGRKVNYHFPELLILSTPIETLFCLTFYKLVLSPKMAFCNTSRVNSEDNRLLV